MGLESHIKWKNGIKRGRGGSGRKGKKGFRKVILSGRKREGGDGREVKVRNKQGKVKLAGLENKSNKENKERADRQMRQRGSGERGK